MNASKKFKSSTKSNSLDIDIEKTKKSIEHILALFGSPEVMNKNLYTDNHLQRQSKNKTVDSNKSIMYNYEKESRNGLTPRTAYTQSYKDTDAMIEDHRAVGDDIDSDNKNSKSINKDHNKIVAPCYHCDYCGARFTIKSLLGAHRRSHDDENKERFNAKRQSSGDNMPIDRNQCQFCDRKFHLERTLHIHQMCHCKKISPAERRSLKFTVLEHESKPPLPERLNKAQYSTEK